jgi:hypothetical protein
LIPPKCSFKYCNEADWGLLIFWPAQMERIHAKRTLNKEGKGTPNKKEEEKA